MIHSAVNALSFEFSFFFFGCDLLVVLMHKVVFIVSYLNYENAEPDVNNSEKSFWFWLTCIPNSSKVHTYSYILEF